MSWLQRTVLGGAADTFSHDGAREIAQRLRALNALPEDLGSIPSTHMVPGDLIPSSGFCGHQSHMQHTDMHAGKIPQKYKQMNEI